MPQFVWNITNTKQKEIYIEMVDHGKVTETYVAEYFRIKYTVANSFT